VLSDPSITRSPSGVQTYQRQLRRRLRTIASKVWNCVVIVPNELSQPAYVSFLPWHRFNIPANYLGLTNVGFGGDARQQHSK
jgi:hypothetical protein